MSLLQEKTGERKGEQHATAEKGLIAVLQTLTTHPLNYMTTYLPTNLNGGQNDSILQIF